MDRWQAVRNIIENNKKFILFTHISADGDALGSVTALALFLNKMGKETFILLEENPQTVLRYVLDKDINYGIYSENEVYPEFDVSIAIDTASKDRLGKRSQIFEKSNYCVSIDHHQSKEFFAQINVCNPMWAATCEGIWELMETYADVEDKDICQSIFTGIMTDTGSFAYSNTTSNTHMIATKIINICGDQSWQYRRIFESVTKSELDLRRIAYSKLEYYFDNTVVLL
ncbi:MAG: DHH family phosphoesterase, partial [Lachnospiraceae bacterium]|nr:DHH family phosphoesterase [Lachnospiraceae bacterium]